MIMEDFVTLEITKKLKEKGFPIKTKTEGKFGLTKVKEADILPTISQVLKWLREKKGWIIVVRLYSTNGWYWFIQDKNGELKSSHLASCDDCFATYEQAALAGIEYALDNLI